MQLYYCETLNPRKACAVARHLNSPVEFKYVDLATGENRAPEFVAINPNAKVPVLVDGETTLWEANAIMAHLARKAGSPLWPRDDQQVELLRWLSWDAQHFTHHAGTLYFQHLIKPALGMGDPDPTAVAEATGFFRRFANVLNDHLQGRKFLLGETPTIADFAVAVTFPYAEGAKIPLADFTEIARYSERMNTLPGWREPFPAQAMATA